MTPRTLFSIILKILGILFVKDVLLAIPELVVTLRYFIRFDDGGSFGSLALFILSVGFYVWVAYCLLFRTDWIIDKLSLDAGFEVDAIRINMHRSTVLSICIIIIGALIITNAIPLFVRHIFLLIQQIKLQAPSTDKSYLILYGVQIIIGLLVLGNQRHIVNFIESRRTKADNEDFDDEIDERQKSKEALND